MPLEQEKDRSPINSDECNQSCGNGNILFWKCWLRIAQGTYWNRMSLPNFWRACWVLHECFRFLHIREGVGVLISNDENHCFFVIQLEHVSFQPLADTGDREFHFTMAILGEVLSLRLNSWGNWVSSAYRW